MSGFAFWQTPIHPEDQELLIGGAPYSYAHSPSEQHGNIEIELNRLRFVEPVSEALKRAHPYHRIAVRWAPDLNTACRIQCEGEHITPEGIAPLIFETIAAKPQTTQPLEANQMSVLKQFCFNATREQITALFADETVPLETLQMCAFVALGGSPSELGATVAAAPAPVAPSNGNPTASPNGKRRGRPPKASVEASGSDGPVDAIVRAIAGQNVGFAVGDVVAAASCSKAQASGAIKRLQAQGVLKNYGDRRFSRYGATQAIAKAASDTSRGK